MAVYGCLFPWYKYSQHGQYQATNVISFTVELALRAWLQHITVMFVKVLFTLKNWKQFTLKRIGEKYF